MIGRRGFAILNGLVVVAASAFLGHGGTARADIVTLDVTADFDGQDQLIIQGNTLQYLHFDYTPVGLHNSNYPSTIITTTLNGVTVLDDYAWTPTWPNGTGSGDYSSIFTGLTPAAPSQDAQVSLDVLQGRGSLTLAQLPTQANGYTTILDFNDDPFPSDAIYEAKVTFVTSSSVPEPSGLALLCIGAVGLIACARRLRANSSANLG